MNTARATFQHDQYRAAVADTRRIMNAIAAQPGARAALPRDQWINGQLAALYAAMVKGTARPCPHITTAPRVLHAALWAPGVIACTGCAPALLAPASDSEDCTCDRCRTTVGRIHPAAVAAGPLLLTFGLCDPCAHRTGLTPALPPRAPTPSRPHTRSRPAGGARGVPEVGHDGEGAR